MIENLSPIVMAFKRDYSSSIVHNILFKHHNNNINQYFQLNRFVQYILFIITIIINITLDVTRRVVYAKQVH